MPLKKATDSRHPALPVGAPAPTSEPDEPQVGAVAAATTSDGEGGRLLTITDRAASPVPGQVEPSPQAVESGPEPQASVTPIRGALTASDQGSAPASPAGTQARRGPAAGRPDAAAPTSRKARQVAPSPATSKASQAAPVPSGGPVVIDTGSLVEPDPEAPRALASFLTPPGPQQVARIELSHRKKHGYNYTWPAEDVKALKAAHKACAKEYRRYWRASDPLGVYRLSISSFLASAIVWAFQRPEEWLSTVRNDARKEPTPGGRAQIGVIWPMAMDDLVLDMCEDAEERDWPEGFVLTKQHLTLAAALHGVASAEEWVLSCSNDDRYSIPTDEDGRVKRKTQPPTVED